MLLKMTCLWHPSAWLSARLWLARAKLSLSPALLASLTFTFSLDSKEAASLPKKKKKSSPSTLRRNAERREKFLKRKAESSPRNAQDPIQRPPAISHTSMPFSATEAEVKYSKCDQCDERFQSNHGLICHTETAHRVVPDLVQCTHCGQTFLSKQDLIFHNVNTHALRLSSNLPLHSDPYQHLIPEGWG